MDHTMARPCKHDTTHFLRTLSPAQRAILMHAGQGDISRGWHEVLDLYATIHALTNKLGTEQRVKDSAPSTG